MATPSATVIDTGETFRLRNDHATDDLVVADGKRTIRVAPGKTALVSFDVIRVHWGDPRSRPEVYGKFSDSKETGYINKREDEITRLGILYGSYASDQASLVDPEWPPNSAFAIEPKRVPHPISVQTESGQAVIPACFDTGGEAIYAALKNDREDLNDAVAYREHLEKRMDEMREEIRSLSGVESGDDAEVDIPR